MSQEATLGRVVTSSSTHLIYAEAVLLIKSRVRRKLGSMAKKSCSMED